jgi:SAM-dependent methyltransferase
MLRKYLHMMLHKRPRIIVDTGKRLGNFNGNNIGYNANLLKEELSREYVLGMPGKGLKFLDVGGKDGELRYLLGITKNLEFDPKIYAKNFALFSQKYEYFGLDLNPVGNENLLVGDICHSDFLESHGGFQEAFDVIYSNNVFEHLRRPWIAAQHLTCMVKPGGLIITVVPFSQRYHEDPEDFFRYTHRGIISLFEDYGAYDVLQAGYDIAGRRNDWQGSGNNNDLVPQDKFGAWRETWFTVAIMRKRTIS